MSTANPPLITVVSPVYRSEEIVSTLVQRIKAVLGKLTDNFEIVLVDDRSPDNCWERISKESEQDSRVRGIRLSRNFGQHIAIYAGLEASRGDYVVVMDCDLQEDPEEILRMYSEVQKGHDLVNSRRVNRASTQVRSLLAALFHKMLFFLTDQIESNYQEGTLTLLSRKVVNAYLSAPDANGHFLLILKWLGFSAGHIEIEHRERFSGKSSYTWKKLLTHGVNGVVAHSTKLLTISVIFGFTFVALSLLSAAILIVLALTSGFKEGWASVVVLILFCTGTILSSLGVVGLYVGKIFEQSKGRPMFVVAETT